MSDFEIEDDYDYCEECHLYGDDYYYDEETEEYIWRCDTCAYSPNYDYWEDD